LYFGKKIREEMIQHKVLIVTYYWPPAGGPGVQRWLKFSKYLPEFGILPIIYTPENPSYPMIDETLEKEISEELEIIKKPIWEPYQIAEKINPSNRKFKAGQFGSSQKKSLLSRLSIFIRGNFFIPDARKFWVKPSVRFLKKYLEENNISTIITTGPPHSMHLIGLKLKKKNPELRWLSDFRDPWTQISYHSDLNLTKKSQEKHLKLEAEVIQKADLVLATSFTDAKNFQMIGAKRVEVITNGFEPQDFRVGKILSSKFKLTYSGGLEEARNPLILWEVLKDLVHENAEFASNLELVFYGNLSQEVHQSIRENGLESYLNLKGYVSHLESIQGIKNADLLFLTNFNEEKSRGIIPGKVFEYMATGNPILAIGPEQGDVEKILKETQSGKYFSHYDVEGIKVYLLKIYEEWEKGEIKAPTPKTDYFSRRNLSQKLADILKEQS
jgi:glycosyltransferase involved in cell wall biosynthesis